MMAQMETPPEAVEVVVPEALDHKEQLTQTVVMVVMDHQSQLKVQLLKHMPEVAAVLVIQQELVDLEVLEEAETELLTKVILLGHQEHMPPEEEVEEELPLMLLAPDQVDLASL